MAVGSRPEWLLAWLGSGGALGALVAMLARPIAGRGQLDGLSRFKIEREVAQGGMGIVYRALDRATGNPVALKLLLNLGDAVRTRASDDAAAVLDERFSREISILAGLDHPRIAGYVDHGRAGNGQAYLAMQWLDGEDLKAVLARGPLSLADSMHVLVGASEGLAVVHAHGIIHRDLKPGNLFLRGGSASDLVLLDFGLARRLEGDSGLTRSAAVLGTPQYMSPEQASSAAQVRPATDVFALGCIFYECLTGKRAFGADNMVGMLARILFDNPEPVAALRPDVPEPWQELIGRMLSKDAAARPPDGAALLRELRALPEAAARPAAVAPVTRVAMPEADSGDQVLVCVVLASTIEGPATALDETPLAGSQVPPVSRSAFDSMRTALGRSGCAIEHMADGSVLATIFPRASAADQARIAATCALSLRELLPRARIAVTTGLAPLKVGARVGEAVDRAARLLGSSADGIRLDSLTGKLLDAHFATELKAGTLLLVGERPDFDQERLLLGKPTPCVGREVELGQLERLMATVVEEAAPKAAVVIGPPGIGKSRLRHELLRRLRDLYPQAQVLIGYGDPLNAGSPYVIASDALRRRAQILVGEEPARARAAVVELGRRVEESQRRRVTEFLGELCGIPFPDEDSPPLRAARQDNRAMNEQIALAFLDWMAVECAAAPLVFVLEDMQWADALSIRLMEVAMRDLKTGSLLVVGLGRPETEETFPKLLAGARALSLSLRPLGGRASEALVKGVLGETIAGDGLRRLVQLAGGNALFLEELIRAAADGQAGDVPETVVAMLQARLSRLPPEARMVLRAASILGETFWRGSVEHICKGWGGAEDCEHWLDQLVEAELVERPRTSRFPGAVEYAFRHALVCDAARGLVGDADLRSGHAAAGRWLEAMGEQDGIVLARHAEEAHETERAIACYVRAAEQSIVLHDFQEALARAIRGVSCGAQGEPLGILTSVRSSALYSMGRWRESAELGLEALTLLPPGEQAWCLTIERLMQVLPNVGDVDSYNRLAAEMLRIVPPPAARDAYLRALNVQLLGYAISGLHEPAKRCLAHIDEVDGGVSERDIVARGYAGLWRAVVAYLLGNDIARALELADQALRDLTEAQVMYRVSLAHQIRSFILWGLGLLAEAEQAARRGQAVAAEIRDGYHSAQAAWYVGLALGDQPDEAKLEEALDCARMVRQADIGPLHDTYLPLVLTGRVALARGDYARAVDDCRRAQAGIAALTPFALMVSTYQVQALVRSGRSDEAAAVAREGLAALAKLAGPVCTEVMFEVAAAEALWETGAQVEARRVLGQARAHVDLRTSLISDEALRDSYLTHREENRRLAELERAWAAGG